MKIISFIYERKVIKKILDHLGLFDGTQPERKRAPYCDERSMSTNLKGGAEASSAPP